MRLTDSGHASQTLLSAAQHALPSRSLQKQLACSQPGPFSCKRLASTGTMGSKGSEVELPDSEDEEQAAHGAEEAGVTPSGCAVQQTLCLRPAKPCCTRKAAQPACALQTRRKRTARRRPQPAAGALRRTRRTRMTSSPRRRSCSTARRQTSGRCLTTGAPAHGLDTPRLQRCAQCSTGEGLRSLQVSRRALLPKVLSVQGAELALRAPFKSPHPQAPARSDVRLPLKALPAPPAPCFGLAHVKASLTAPVRRRPYGAS